MTTRTDQHWHYEVDINGFIWLSLDYQHGSANVLSGAVLKELGQLLEKIAPLQAKGLILRSAKPKGFIAGADVSEFSSFMNQQQATEGILRAKPIFERLESLPFPTVAMIHGYCLGGGLELALCCDYRVAEDGPTTRLGLPEVKMGIHPGFGGTVRLPRLIGPLPGLELMLTGRSITPQAALKLGLVDAIAPSRHLTKASLRLLTHLPSKQHPSWRHRLLNWAPLRPVVAKLLREKTRTAAPEAHYPAPYALIDLWQRHAGNPQRMYHEEALSTARLMLGNSSRNLVRLFTLREQLKAPGYASKFHPKRVHVIGAGLMGGDIAAWCAQNGLTVTLQDQDNQQIGRALQRANCQFMKKNRDPRLVQEIQDRLIPDPHGHGVERADVVIEAVFENLEVKQKILSSVQARLHSEAVLATNTSSIPLEQIASVLNRPEELIGLHFFNPVAKMPLLEVVVGRLNDPERLCKGCGFALAIDRLPLMVKSGPGFLINRILMPYLLEAITLVEEGVAPEEIDQAAIAFGMPMGPVQLADVVGLSVCLSVAHILAPQLGIAVPKSLEKLVESGHLGRKTGQGFYHYHQDQLKGSSFKATRHPPEDLQDRLIYPILNESIACLREGVVMDGDLLDAGVVYGTGFAPFRGGPLRLIQEQGIPPTLTRLKELSQRHGARFIPDAGWEANHLKRLLQKKDIPNDQEQASLFDSTLANNTNIIHLVPNTG
ncbi:MAG: 3-hydroxyacyl-CoA dehydrogenase NAD-binding domain-containing protein [Magnetococcus sp. DMHC-6]